MGIRAYKGRTLRKSNGVGSTTFDPDLTLYQSQQTAYSQINMGFSF
ncbi:MAG: hypothetical protein ACUVRD_04350 [Bacteroidia bacterium]